VRREHPKRIRTLRELGANLLALLLQVFAPDSALIRHG
jgi:hypothetical protein